MINVILADDHQIVIDGLVSILEKEADIKVVGTANDGNEVITLLNDQQIDIAILDIEMPEKTGVQLSLYIQEHHPQIKVLILTMYKTQSFVNEIIEAGAKGYILKNKGSEELVKAIRIVQEGKSYIGQEIMEVLFEALREKKAKPKHSDFQLTRREKEVLPLIVKGYSSPQIGKILHIAACTVDTHRRNLIEKTGVANSRELITYAITNGLVKP